MSGVVGVWSKATYRGSKVRIGRSVGFTMEGREGCQSVLQSWAEKVRLGLWEQKERRRSTSRLPGFPA